MPSGLADGIHSGMSAAIPGAAAHSSAGRIGPVRRAGAHRADLRQDMCCPPLIAMFEPVTNAASSEHR